MPEKEFPPGVKALRLPYAVAFVALACAVYGWVIHPWMLNWGATPEERHMDLPGAPAATAGVASTWAVPIDAPAEVVWQWLVQIGQDKAGFYTYTWLENLVGADIHNADTIHPEWQRLSVGDSWRLVSPDYLFGLGEDAKSAVLRVDPGRTLVIEMFGSHVIQPVDENTSRLLVRGESGPPGWLRTWIADPIVFTMERRMLLGLKARAEGRPDAPAWLLGIAWIGWLAAGVGLAAGFLSRKRGRLWIVLPILAALPALVTSGDFQAGLAGFLAAGIPVLGFLMLGRAGWGPLLVIGSAVLLTLLLAPEAFVALGLVPMAALLAVLAGGVVGHRGARAALRDFRTWIGGWDGDPNATAPASPPST